MLFYSCLVQVNGLDRRVPYTLVMFLTTQRLQILLKFLKIASRKGRTSNKKEKIMSTACCLAMSVRLCCGYVQCICFSQVRMPRPFGEILLERWMLLRVQ
eukprot:4068492-Amphidinium_carterae.1